VLRSVHFGCLTRTIAYRDKKVVGVFVRFRAPLQMLSSGDFFQLLFATISRKNIQPLLPVKVWDYIDHNL
jgi:hypothetical protein